MQININFSPLSLEFDVEEDLILSEVIPVFNDLGIKVLREEKRDDKIIFYICHECCLLELENNYKNVIEIINEVLHKNTPTCKLLSLSLKENFSLREINLFRTFLRYENQLFLEFNLNSIIECLSKNHSISKLFLDYFYDKFNGQEKLENLEKEILEALKSVSGAEDKILKMFFKIIQNTIKTNYFENKEAISIKVDTKHIKHYLKGIQPNLEIFVFHKDFSGVHLRMSKVARGGLRYSSRNDDFRVEIKSLMATQEGKNAIIVPSGAKGGFVIRKKELSKDEFKEIYSTFIDAMLDLIDEDDNYFVVAADKGTSHMSDVANEISLKRGYWLGDAFASGGSKGYSHKELGITAKGALKSTERFFIERGIDFYKTPITVVGIGSMGGDVFGNGMIQSKYFKLVGAISHDEVFIDPNPDIDIAFEERKRLFYSDKHKWSNYDKSKISKGGGVWKRFEQDIRLSEELKQFLDLEQSSVSGEELAQALLRLKVDMLYNGGVGTYIKSSNETNLEVGDKENEYVRVDANEVRAFCICEGGNLGLTQQARYEYALNGGKINLDSIDNAAGVNTSDHEVNLKIILNPMVQDGKITEEERIKTLKSLTDWVEDKVLKDNYLQALALSLDSIRSKLEQEKFLKTIHILEDNLEVFKRRYFSMPNDKQIELILDSEGKIIRPVLSVLILYAKIFLKNLLNRSDIVEKDTFFTRYLFKYFPQDFSNTFKEQILEHKLKKEIISTVIANKIINNVGSTFIYDFSKLGEKNFILKIKSYLIMNQLLDLATIRENLHSKKFEKNTLEQYAYLLELEKEVCYNTKWIIKNLQNNFTYDMAVTYKESIKERLDFDSHEVYNNIDSFFDKLKKIKFAITAVKINMITKVSYDLCVENVFEIVNKFHILLLMEKLDKLIVKDPTKEDLKVQLEDLIQKFIVEMSKTLFDFKTEQEHISGTLQRYIKKRNFDEESYQDKIEELRKAETFSIYQIATLVNSLLLI